MLWDCYGHWKLDEALCGEDFGSDGAGWPLLFKAAPFAGGDGTKQMKDLQANTRCF